MSDLCQHGHERNRLPGWVAWAGPTANCECCGMLFGYFFIGDIGPPRGAQDLCEDCGGVQVREQPSIDETPTLTLEERLQAFKASKTPG